MIDKVEWSKSSAAEAGRTSLSGGRLALYKQYNVYFTMVNVNRGSGGKK